MKKLKQNAYYRKINILAEKAQMIFNAFLNHFSIVIVWLKSLVCHGKKPLFTLLLTSQCLDVLALFSFCQYKTKP